MRTLCHDPARSATGAGKEKGAALQRSLYRFGKNAYLSVMIRTAGDWTLLAPSFSEISWISAKYTSQ